MIEFRILLSLLYLFNLFFINFKFYSSRRIIICIFGLITNAFILTVSGIIIYYDTINAEQIVILDVTIALFAISHTVNIVKTLVKQTKGWQKNKKLEDKEKAE